jgi:hypothetical protein
MVNRHEKRKEFSHMLDRLFRIALPLVLGFALMSTFLIVTAPAQQEPPGATPVSSSSGNVANATATATLTGTAGRWTYVCGVSFTPGFATAGAAVTATITNTPGGTLTFTVSTTPNTAGPPPIVIPFTPCLQANSTGNNIVVSMPALGAGNTNASVSAWGFLK